MDYVVELEDPLTRRSSFDSDICFYAILDVIYVKEMLLLCIFLLVLVRRGLGRENQD